MTIEAILKECGFSYPLVVVSVGGEVVPRELYSTFRVEDGSNVKVLHLVAGG
jgi:sulfur carrier protein